MKTPSVNSERRFRWPGKFGMLSVALLVAIGAVSCATYNLMREEPATTPGASVTGSKSCLECHEDAVKAFDLTTHGPLSRKNAQMCESCHGPASLHIQSGGETNLIVRPNDASCLVCHMDGGDHAHGSKKMGMDWQFAEHKRAGVKCIDCHDAHSHAPKGLRGKPELQVQNMDAASSLCLSCHQEVLGRISMPSHHPIREGVMSCTSCHNPHANQSRQLLSKNETCFKCHQAQQGPFAREHQPVVEDCTICHDPHGSPTAKLAKVPQPMLCLQCHPLTMNRHQNVGQNVSPAALRNCTACHGAIHGSDLEPYFRH
jgi:DmsE family decaheme c-type cytochrome